MDDNNNENLPYESKKLAAPIAAKSFFGPCILSTICSFVLIDNTVHQQWHYFLPIIFTTVFIAFIYFYSQFYSNHFYVSVITITLGLSFIFSFGLQLTIANISTENAFGQSFGLYLMIISLFHYGEFQITSIVNLNALSCRTFLLNNGYEYNVALIISMIEFILESFYFPKYKFIFHPYLTYLGFSICLIGDCLRKLAMYQAGHNFNHIIQTNHYSDHHLITNGIYSIFRHPSYVGWFYWSIGSQIILQNPISFVGYVIVSWRFFNQRIEFEEITLINFFGQKYLNYKEKVPTGLPFINGY